MAQVFKLHCHPRCACAISAFDWLRYTTCTACASTLNRALSGFCSLSLPSNPKVEPASSCYPPRRAQHECLRRDKRRIVVHNVPFARQGFVNKLSRACQQLVRPWAGHLQLPARWPGMAQRGWPRRFRRLHRELETNWLRGCVDGCKGHSSGPGVGREIRECRAPRSFPARQRGSARRGEW
jgi:hypothetical protein